MSHSVLRFVGGPLDGAYRDVGTPAPRVYEVALPPEPRALWLGSALHPLVGPQVRVIQYQMERTEDGETVYVWRGGRPATPSAERQP